MVASGFVVVSLSVLWQWVTSSASVRGAVGTPFVSLSRDSLIRLP